VYSDPYIGEINKDVYPYKIPEIQYRFRLWFKKSRLRQPTKWCSDWASVSKTSRLDL